ncbi:ABC transporter permease [Phosphitispora fastidiosa]|uniref:ABC transporter permease n=1 Tax=Phosphitispora fastidiosa TaxID=2837202 RepID=UPI001E49993C|nr:ABC transporter permease [Phosphitispora fastidiosa]MBU7006213.1 simple sugar transport system permease protein [Phosphitispora fastidiosa]
MSGLPIGRDRVLVLEKRGHFSQSAALLVPVISILGALLSGSLFLLATGYNPVEIYVTMLSGAFGSAYGLSETVVKAIPLLLCGLAVSVAFRMQLWNIGAEGQLYMGAVAASGVALFYGEGSRIGVLALMFLAAVAAGGIWGLIPAIPRALFKVNETITTLMLNYVAILFSNYLVYGPWKDPKGMNFPLSAVFPESAVLPCFGDTRIHLGLVFGLVAAVLLYIILWHTKWGYEIRVIGESPVAARYAGMNTARNILLVMALSGGLAGLAGMAEVSGIIQRLQPNLSPGYGYTAIIVAWLGRLNPFAITGVSFLLAGLLVGGYNMQMSGLPAAIVSILQGAILFFILGGEMLTKYRIRIRNPRGIEVVE